MRSRRLDAFRLRSDLHEINRSHHQAVQAGRSARSTVGHRRGRHHGHGGQGLWPAERRSEEHTSELQSLMRSSYAVFCLKKKKERVRRPMNRQEKTTKMT